MATKNIFKINPKLILIKVHYFSVLGGLSGFLPYASLFGKSLNMNATAIGLCFTTVKCAVLISKPLFGSLVDYYRNIKLFLMGFLFTMIISFLGLMFIPPIPTAADDTGDRELPQNYSLTSQKQTDCSDLGNIKDGLSTKMKNTSELFAAEEFQLGSFDLKTEKEHPCLLTTTFSSMNDSRNFSEQMDFSIMNKTEDESMVKVLKSYQFWTFAILVVTSGMAFENALSLSDVACYELLESQRHLYGSQRMFGTIGWAMICPLSGFLNDISSAKNKTKDYSPGVYILIILLSIDILLVSKIPMMKTKYSKDMSGDLRKVIRSFDVVLFTVGATAIGGLTSMISNYEFWHLQDLGASQTLMGTTVVVQCLIEIPMFVVSAWALKKFGSFNCLVLSFTAFAIRCGSYYMMHNPWFALVIDTTHGLTFALFHVSLTHFASVSAPDGMEATVMGILSAMTRGLGAATGNLIAGAAMDRYGGRLMFGFASVFSAVCAICFTILPQISKIIKKAYFKKSHEIPVACEAVDLGESVV